MNNLTFFDTRGGSGYLFTETIPPTTAPAGAGNSFVQSSTLSSRKGIDWRCFLGSNISFPLPPWKPSSSSHSSHFCSCAELIRTKTRKTSKFVFTSFPFKSCSIESLSPRASSKPIPTTKLVSELSKLCVITCTTTSPSKLTAASVSRCGRCYSMGRKPLLSLEPPRPTLGHVVRITKEARNGRQSC